MRDSCLLASLHGLLTQPRSTRQGIPPTVGGGSSHVNNWSLKCPIDLCLGQSDGGIFSNNSSLYQVNKSYPRQMRTRTHTRGGGHQQRQGKPCFYPRSWAKEYPLVLPCLPGNQFGGIPWPLKCISVTVLFCLVSMRKKQCLHSTIVKNCMRWIPTMEIPHGSFPFPSLFFPYFHLFSFDLL